ncbi:MAG: UDP-2,3-diacylglucosamine diphosphatase LpxI [Pseudomonadota bacterium]
MTDAVGIIAGSGTLPKLLAQTLKAQDKTYTLIGLDGFCQPDWLAEHPHVRLRIGAMGSMIDHFRRAGVRRLCFAGGVTRPSLRSLMPDVKALKLAGELMMRGLGDDGVLSKIAAAFEAEGFVITSAQDLLPSLLARRGVMGRAKPSRQNEADIIRGRAVLAAMSEADVGQGCVVCEHIVLAVEAFEGTDAMIARAGQLRPSASGGVLIKAAKTTQDVRLDAPTIGPDTIKAAKAAGLAGVAIQAGRVLVIDQAQVIAQADQAGKAGRAGFFLTAF